VEGGAGPRWGAIIRHFAVHGSANEVNNAIAFSLQLIATKPWDVCVFVVLAIGAFRLAGDIEATVDSVGLAIVGIGDADTRGGRRMNAPLLRSMFNDATGSSAWCRHQPEFARVVVLDCARLRVSRLDSEVSGGEANIDQSRCAW